MKIAYPPADSDAQVTRVVLHLFLTVMYLFCRGMVKKRATRSWSEHNVPMEIWTEILARLPVRSLVRFRCVSRSWKTVIDNPDFCRDHLVRFKNNCRDHLLMVYGEYHYERQCKVRCSDTMDTSWRLGQLSGSWDIKTQEYKSTAFPGINGSWKIWFSVDGLVMLKCDYRDSLMLWNPSIRKCRLVPHFQDPRFFDPDLDLSLGFDPPDLDLGLGFDPLIRDYKLVRVSMRTPSSVQIYTVGTDSWKAVATQGAFPSTWDDIVNERRTIYFKGCLYMLSFSELISFDLSREVFKSVDLPEYKKSAPEHDNSILLQRALVEMGSSLAVFQYAAHGGSVWVLDDNASAASSWTMRCTFTTDIVSRFLYLKKNGDLLFTKYDRKIVSYNIHTEAEKVVTNFLKITTDIRDVRGYKESLVLLKSSTLKVYSLPYTNQSDWLVE